MQRRRAAGLLAKIVFALRLEEVRGEFARTRMTTHILRSLVLADFVGRAWVNCVGFGGAVWARLGITDWLGLGGLTDQRLYV